MSIKKFSECDGEFWELILAMVMEANHLHDIISKDVMDKQENLCNDICNMFSKANLTKDDYNKLEMTIALFGKECMGTGAAIGVRATQLCRLSYVLEP